MYFKWKYETSQNGRQGDHVRVTSGHPFSLYFTSDGDLAVLQREDAVKQRTVFDSPSNRGMSCLKKTKAQGHIIVVWCDLADRQLIKKKKRDGHELDHDSHREQSMINHAKITEFCYS